MNRGSRFSVLGSALQHFSGPGDRLTSFSRVPKSLSEKSPLRHEATKNRLCDGVLDTLQPLCLRVLVVFRLLLGPPLTRLQIGQCADPQSTIYNLKSTIYPTTRANDSRSV